MSTIYEAAEELRKQRKTSVWGYWCKAIGSKAYEEDTRADRVAIVRTFWVCLHIITCFAIIANFVMTHLL
jgi:hypothetical protein